MSREAADEREAWAIALGISTAATLFAGREAVSAHVCGQGLRLVLNSIGTPSMSVNGRAGLPGSG
jgi:hypothetical protein